VDSRCTRLDAARDRPAPAPRGRPVRLALARRTVTVHFTPEDYATLVARDSIPNGSGLPVPQFIRTLLGFVGRFSSMPESEERLREVDDAWDRLRRLGTHQCPASTTFPGPRQLFFPIDDNYKLYELTSPTYTGSDRGGG